MAPILRDFESNKNVSKLLQYQDLLVKLLPDLHKLSEHDDTDSTKKILTKPVTFQVTDDCNLRCSYCYQINKGIRKLDIETAKKFIDGLLSGKYDNYISINNSPGIILEFIGGEPFLEIDLIDQIVDYFLEQALLLRHQWANYYRIGICSNGVLYRDSRVQKFLEKHKKELSFSVTLDGNKELHDSCRVFDNGSGSYDLAYDACIDWIDKGNFMGSKITIAKENLDYLSEAILHMIDLGYKEINSNCVYEADWNKDDALKLYNQMVILADYILDNDIYDSLYLSLFQVDFFKPKKEDDLTNWCGGTGSMLSIDPDGYLFPCIRYMESSLGDSRERYSIGHVDDGIGKQKCYCDRIDCLNNVDRRTESTDECFYCPIADGCSWCSAWNYQVFGTPDSRVITICIMHKARSLANAYFWNKVFIKYNFNVYFKIYALDEWILDILDKKEFDILKKLESDTKNRIGVKDAINKFKTEKEM